MSSKIVWLYALLASSLMAQVSVCPVQTQVAATLLRHHTVLIEVDEPNKGTCKGTGCWIDGTHVLTAYHVVSDAVKIHIKGMVCKVLAFDKAQDIAIITVPKPQHFTTIKVAKFDPRHGDLVFGWSIYDHIRTKTAPVPILTLSYIAALGELTPWGATEFILFGQILCGGSGSAFFNASGELLGVLTSCKFSGGQEWFICLTDFHAVNKLLKKAGVGLR